MASPTTAIAFTRSASTRRQTSVASKTPPPVVTTVPPPNSVENANQCPAACMNGGIASAVMPGCKTRVGKLARGGDVVAQGQRVTATHGREEDVVVSPEHALGHAGRAARVDAVEVVAAAWGNSRASGADARALS